MQKPCVKYFRLKNPSQKDCGNNMTIMSDMTLLLCRGLDGKFLFQVEKDRFALNTIGSNGIW